MIGEQDEPVLKWRGKKNKSRDEFNFIFASGEKRIDGGNIIKYESSICDN
jgi:hypothetical protein